MTDKAQQVIVAPSIRDFPILAVQLSAWLGNRLPDAEEVQVENLSYPFGAGQSHETILFDAMWRTDGKRQSQGFVVRIKPTKHTVFPDDRFKEQYKLMRLLREDGRVRVARTFWLEEDASILGAPFFVMEKLNGRVAVSIPPYADIGWVADATPGQRAKLWENGVRQLAAIQSVPLSSVQFLAGPAAARDGLAQEWDKYTRFAEWVTQYRSWPVLTAALKRLRESWPANQPPGLVWGDARLGNMMFDDNFEVVAVMDWEQPSLGGALHDLAWWVVNAELMHGEAPGRSHLAGMGTREETIALWRELTNISTADLEWYEDFTRFKLSCLSIRTFALKGAPLPESAWLAKRLKVSLSD